MTARIKFSPAIASCAAAVPAPATVIPAPAGIPRSSETPLRGPAPCGKSFRHSKSDHFPATTQLAKSDHRTKISYENMFSSYARGPIASYESTSAKSTNTPPPSRRTSHPDTNLPHLLSLLPPNSEHQSLAGSKLIIGPLVTPKQPTTAYIQIRTALILAQNQDTSPYLVQSYGRNKVHTRCRGAGANRRSAGDGDHWPWRTRACGHSSRPPQALNSHTIYPPREGEAWLGVKE